jgi:hypothetical protein
MIPRTPHCAHRPHVDENMRVSSRSSRARQDNRQTAVESSFLTGWAAMQDEPSEPSEPSDKPGRSPGVGDLMLSIMAEKSGVSGSTF